MADLQRIGAPVRLDAARGLRLSSSIKPPPPPSKFGDLLK
jgi:hypothetical protein